MTELQLGMIGLSTTVVVGVFAYNKWQEIRHRKLAESVLQPQHDDVLLDSGSRRAPPHEKSAAPATPAPAPVERREPVLADVADSAPPADEAPEVPVAIDDAVEPPPAFVARRDEPLLPPQSPEPPVVIEPSPVQAVAQAAEPAGQPAADEVADVQPGEVPAELLDPRLEFIVAMEMVESVPARQILHSQREALQRLTKPVHWLGFNERNREWERLASDSEMPVRRLRVGLQLVNRLGPVSEGDVATFNAAMQELADELMAVADVPKLRVLDQAAEIDRFCAAVDLEIGLNLVSRGMAFPGTKIRALAEAAGMELGVDGLFTRYNDDGHPQFSLQNYETTRFTADSLRTLTTHGLTFLLDVPRVDHGERVFLQMTELARRFGETLQGALVDDNRQPLGEAQLEHIRREFIGKPQATMTSFGLPAGSPQARRLFS